MPTNQETVEKRALDSITATDLLAHITALASDEFAGRCPGTEGEAKTIEYFQNYFDTLSRSSGRQFETHLQSVPATEIHSKPSLTLAIAGSTLELHAPEQYVASSLTLEPAVAVKNSEAVFVGYGVVAPEYGWDDYKGLDVRGKTLVMLCGDPQIPHRSGDGLDESMFRGGELTYYGRWTYKYEIAAKLGAAAVFIIHETERAGYGYDVVKAGFGATNFALNNKAEAKKHVPIQGWFALDTVKDVLTKSGFDFAELKNQALSKDFKPFPLKFQIDATIESTFRDFKSQNFVAISGNSSGSATAGTNSGSTTVGSNSGAATVVTNSGVTSSTSTATDHVVYMAHWDHFGVTDAGILSGALDNASGVASVLCIAKAFSVMPPLARSVVFVIPTLEEHNLLGSKFYVANPVVPISACLAGLNMEILGPWGVSNKFSSVCLGHTSLDDYLEQCAHAQGRVIVREPEVEKGYLYRSDHLEYMRVGIPCLAAFFPCADHMAQRQDYVKTTYHKPTDKVKPDWDLAGAVLDTQLFFEVGVRILADGTRAKWSPTSEFKPRS